MLDANALCRRTLGCSNRSHTRFVRLPYAYHFTHVLNTVDCHTAVHAKGAPRIATDVRIGTRVDREIAPGTGNDHKVKRVEEILAADSESSSS